jgi:Host cell surface-exposed lipoprotein
MKRFVSLAAAVAALGVFAAGCTVPEEPTATSEAHVANVTKKVKKHQKASEPTETVAQENARGSAQDYLDMGGFSRTGLIKQLKFEGFSKADATYAVDAADANWKAEAAQSAEEYMDTGSFSRSALLDQLEFEGFTPAQAAHGVSKVGY